MKTAAPHPPIPSRPTSACVEQTTLITRFSIALLAFTLIGMGLGSTLPPQIGPFALTTGSIGFIAFAILENLAARRYHESANALRAHNEHRLAQLLTDSNHRIAPAAKGQLPSEILKSYAAGIRERSDSYSPPPDPAGRTVPQADPHLIALEV